jgi:hypothetical protein
MVVRIAAEPILPAGGVRRGVAKMTGCRAIFDGAGAESWTDGGGPYENCFTLAAKSRTGV